MIKNQPRIHILCQTSPLPAHPPLPFIGLPPSLRCLKRLLEDKRWDKQCRLVGNADGIFELDLICASEMTSVQFANSPSGPWTQLAQINCNSGKAHLVFQQADNMNQVIYLRTHGSWGSSGARPVKLFYRMTVNLAGLPGDPSNNTDFSIALNGESLQSYRFSFGTNSQDCANEGSYSPERFLFSKEDQIRGTRGWANLFLRINIRLNQCAQLR